MLARKLRFGFSSCVAFWSAAACGAAGWNNSRIMPKSDQVVLRVGQAVTANVYQIEWPAVVERVEGQWLWIVDRNGYSVPPASGWVSNEDVLKLSDAHQYYLDALQTANEPWLHWLAGICLEAKNDRQSAAEEYGQCLGASADNVALVEREPVLLDAALRLARLKSTAARTAKEAELAAGTLASLALAGEVSGPSPSELWCEWGDALRRAYGLKVAEARKGIPELKGRIGRAKLEQEGGAREERDLFAQADVAYRRAAYAKSRRRRRNSALLERRAGPGRALPRGPTSSRTRPGR